MTEEAILEFVHESFRSIWPMELLVVLSQEPRQGWQIAVLVRELRASVSSVIDGLAALAAIQLVSAGQDGAYSFDPISADRAQVARELIDLYNRKPRAVARALYSAPVDRIQTFADAFRLRKDPKDPC